MFAGLLHEIMKEGCVQYGSGLFLYMKSWKKSGTMWFWFVFIHEIMKEGGYKVVLVRFYRLYIFTCFQNLKAHKTVTRDWLVGLKIWRSFPIISGIFVYFLRHPHQEKKVWAGMLQLFYLKNWRLSYLKRDEIILSSKGAMKETHTPSWRCYFNGKIKWDIMTNILLRIKLGTFARKCSRKVTSMLL